MSGFSASNCWHISGSSRPPGRRSATGQQPAADRSLGARHGASTSFLMLIPRSVYAAQAVEYGWSRNVLVNQIKNQTHRRVGAAPSNFTTQLPPGDSELAQQLTKDPLVLSFLGLPGKVAERDLEQAVMDKLTSMLLELGHGFAFVGRQVHFDVAGDDFYVDLLFFHVEQLRYVVVELKVGAFTPEFA